MIQTSRKMQHTKTILRITSFLAKKLWTDTRAVAECVMKFQRITNSISFVCHSMILILSSLTECIIEIVLDWHTSDSKVCYEISLTDSLTNNKLYGIYTEFISVFVCQSMKFQNHPFVYSNLTWNRKYSFSVGSSLLTGAFCDFKKTF